MTSSIDPVVRRPTVPPPASKGLHIPPWVATVGGALITAFGYISQPQVLAILPPKLAAIITAIGGVLVAVGVHTSQTTTHAMLESIGAEKPNP